MLATSLRCFEANTGFRLLLILAHFQLAHAWLWDGPQETGTLDIGSWRIEPTGAPMGDLELFKRQSIIGTSTCGYIGGELNNPITCATGYCGYQSIWSAAACCPTYYILSGTPTLTSCSFRTACYDSTAMNLCSGSCLTDNFVLKCTQSANPFCYEFSYTDISYSNFACSTAKDIVSVAHYIVTLPSTTPVVSTPAASQSLPGWVTTTFTGVSFPRAPSAPVTVAPAPASITTSAISSGPSTHVGIIAAAVIGAAALALVIVGVVLYFCLRKKAERGR